MALKLRWPQWRPPRLEKRLLWLVGLAALLGVAQLALMAWDAHERLDTELHAMDGRIRLLSSTADQVNWDQRATELGRQRDQLLARLWSVPTEAQAQARLRDWLTSALRTAKAGHPTVSLLPVQNAAAVPASAPVATAAAGPAASAPSEESSRTLRVRATVSFDLAPRALEDALQQIERGGQLARIDSLTVSRSSRRVEMAVSVPVTLVHEP